MISEHDLSPPSAMLTAESLSEQPRVDHAFFTRRGGVSEGIFASLNCGFGSTDARERVTENRARAAGRLGLPILVVSDSAHSLVPDIARGITVEKLREGYKHLSIPLGREGRLSEVADAVCFLASDRAGYIHGTTVNMSGGKSRG